MVWPIRAYRQRKDYIELFNARCGSTTRLLLLFLVGLTIAWFWGISENFTKIKNVRSKDAELFCTEFALQQYLANSVLSKGGGPSVAPSRYFLTADVFCKTRAYLGGAPARRIVIEGVDQGEFFGSGYSAHEEANLLISKLRDIPRNLDHEVLYRRIDDLLEPLSMALTLGEDDRATYADAIFKFALEREGREKEKSEVQDSIVNFDIGGIKVSFRTLYSI